ncbi:MAG TPA: thiamine phosphate synthase [Candidatus Brocadiaceae bacterium]|nr:thiamine phosphate synthase [Candidatus Brocadiaceae bacterium]
MKTICAHRMINGMSRELPADVLSLILITDRNLCKRPLWETVKSALKGGVKSVQLREKGLATRELYTLANELRKMTADFGAGLFINDRVDIALAADADGVHLGWQSLPVPVARGLLGVKKLIGVSTHNRREALQAWKDGADYITFGPVFHTPSKAGILDPVGVEALRGLKDEVHVPIAALGGINEGNVAAVLESGVEGIAVISSILSADDAEKASRGLFDIILKHRHS